MKSNTKPLAYFRTEYTRCGGNPKKIIRFAKVMSDGTIKIVDSTNQKTSTIRSFGGIPIEVFNSTKQEFDAALTKVINNLTK